MHKSDASDVPVFPPVERILLTAHDLFYRDGIRATGIDRVIAEAGVTKVTFYRHFPSKNQLILAFLDHRHSRWMDWFKDALKRHGGTGRKGAQALVPALAEWMGSADYRGCAFINSVGELGPTLLEVVEVARNHKRDMVKAIANLLPPSSHRAEDAKALGLAVDGAIVQAQFAASPEAALSSLRFIVRRIAQRAP